MSAGENTMADLPDPPYWAVIFVSTRTEGDNEEYAAMAARMAALAAQQEGFLGLESVREGGLGVTISYWRDEESIASWRRHVEHLEAQRKGREKWYARFETRVARVERVTRFQR